MQRFRKESFLRADGRRLGHEREELPAFAQSPLHHLAVPQHVPHDAQDRARPQVDGPVEPLERFVDGFAVQILVREHRLLDAPVLYEAKNAGKNRLIAYEEIVTAPSDPQS